MSGHNICFIQEISKIIFELSSISLLIWSFGLRLMVLFCELPVTVIKICNILKKLLNVISLIKCNLLLDHSVG